MLTKHLFFNTFLLFTSVIGGVNGQNAIEINLNAEKGFLHSAVGQLMFDQNGNLWVSTSSGLNVYNGQRFIDISSIGMHPRISFLFKDQSNNIYVLDGLNNLYQTKTGRISFKKKFEIGEHSTLYLKKTTNNKDKGSIDEAMFLIQKKLGYKNITPLSNTPFLLNLPPNFTTYKDYFLVDSALVGIKHNHQFDIYTVDGIKQKLKTNLPFNMNEKGLVFQSDQATFWLYNHAIYQLKIEKDSLLSKPILTEILLDKKQNSLNIGHIIITQDTFILEARCRVFTK